MHVAGPLGGVGSLLSGFGMVVGVEVGVGWSCRGGGSSVAGIGGMALGGISGGRFLGVGERWVCWCVCVCMCVRMEGPVRLVVGESRHASGHEVCLRLMRMEVGCAEGLEVGSVTRRPCLRRRSSDGQCSPPRSRCRRGEADRQCPGTSHGGCGLGLIYGMRVVGVGEGRKCIATLRDVTYRLRSGMRGTVEGNRHVMCGLRLCV